MHDYDAAHVCNAPRLSLEKTSVLVRHSKTARQDGSPPFDVFERTIYLTGQSSDEQRRTAT